MKITSNTGYSIYQHSILLYALQTVGSLTLLQSNILAGFQTRLENRLLVSGLNDSMTVTYTVILAKSV